MNPYRAYEPPALPAHVWLRMPGSPALPTPPGEWPGHYGADGRVCCVSDPPVFHYGSLITGYCLCGEPIAFHNLDFNDADGVCARPPIERRCLLCHRQHLELTGGLPSQPTPRRIPPPPHDQARFSVSSDSSFIPHPSSLDSNSRRCA